MIYQNEAEYLRLRESWRHAADAPGTPDAEALRLRYEIWVSRVELLQGERPQRLLQASADHRQTVKAMQDFIARADVGLGRVPRRWPCIGRFRQAALAGPAGDGR